MGHKMSTPIVKLELKLERSKVDDEAHMVFRCAALSAQRQRHASLFSPWPADLRELMGWDPMQLAAFAYDCYKEDKELKLASCDLLSACTFWCVLLCRVCLPVLCGSSDDSPG